MKLKSFAIAAILGISLPVITDIAINHQAVANPPGFPGGEFSNIDKNGRGWRLTLWYQDHAFHYKGVEWQTQNRLCLSGAVGSGSDKRPVFTWRNGNHKYRVAWQPADPDVIRLQVINPSGRIILNELLAREPGEFEDPNATQCR